MGEAPKKKAFDRSKSKAEVGGVLVGKKGEGLKKSQGVEAPKEK